MCVSVYVHLRCGAVVCMRSQTETPVGFDIAVISNISISVSSKDFLNVASNQPLGIHHYCHS